MPAVVETSVPEAKLLARGKVRDIYDFGDKLLFVATDRISAYDVILNQPIADKGKVLHQISRFWFDWIQERGIVGNHLLTDDVDRYPEELRRHREQLEGRSALVHRADMLPVECVARGYITGSGWREYQQTGEVCGIPLPAGLRECSKLPEPIFTPATKATTGHDENISFERASEILGTSVAEKVRDLTLRLYREAAEYAAERGILIADTKFEFGIFDGEIILCDEVLTPDSSRFWPKDEYAPGRGQPSFDKQYVRDWLDEAGWDHEPPPPDLPDDVVAGSRARYLEILEILSGRGLD